MNTGLQDAYNLGWKLALVGKGQAGVALLDSYEEERLPIAQRLLDTTDRAFRVIVSDSALAGVVRSKVIARIAAFLMSFEQIQRFAFRTVSQTGIHYRTSRMSQSLDVMKCNAPRAGDRFPWLRLKLMADGPVDDLYREFDDTRLDLFLFGQRSLPEAMPDEGDLLRIHVVPADAANDTELARAKISQPSFYLVRPDGYIGLCGTLINRDAIGRYFRERLHLRSGQV